MLADYDIDVSGRLGPEMKHALADLRPQVQGAGTRLFARGVDQAQLHGIFWRLRTLVLDIVAVRRTDDGERTGARSDSGRATDG